MAASVLCSSLSVGTDSYDYSYLRLPTNLLYSESVRVCIIHPNISCFIKLMEARIIEQINEYFHLFHVRTCAVSCSFQIVSCLFQIILLFHDVSYHEMLACALSFVSCWAEYQLWLCAMYVHYLPSKYGSLGEP